MLLKNVFLYLNPDEFPNELRSSFGFMNRYICNFLDRYLHKIKFKSNGFSRICIQGCTDPSNSSDTVAGGALISKVSFDHEKFNLLQSDDYHEFFISMLLDGLHKCAKNHAIPLDEICSAITEFREGGYKNEWLHKSKLLRSFGATASLLCRLDINRFCLNLRIEKGKAVIFDKDILETEPDEIIFAYRFKDLIIESDCLVVKNKFGSTEFAVTLRDIFDGYE